MGPPYSRPQYPEERLELLEEGQPVSDGVEASSGRGVRGDPVTKMGFIRERIGRLRILAMLVPAAAQGSTCPHIQLGAVLGQLVVFEVMPCHSTLVVSHAPTREICFSPRAVPAWRRARRRSRHLLQHRPRVLLRVFRLRSIAIDVRMRTRSLSCVGLFPPIFAVPQF